MFYFKIKNVNRQFFVYRTNGYYYNHFEHFTIEIKITIYYEC